MPVRKKTLKKISVETYNHKGKRRKNNPPVGLVSTATDRLNGRTKYQHDPHIDPCLSWAGKAEGKEFDVQNVSLHIHERIDPKRIVQSFLKKKEGKASQLSLFEESDNDPPLNKAIDFYRHEQDWTNRLIAGDSLLVMNSLLKKEGMAGKVQMVYIDPPYGIKYNSNFQPFVNKRDVKDGNDDDIPAEPEMIQAFRDTWELGIHSYLTYLRDRLLLVRELLHESGSVFVQISDENVHHVREICDEVFGKDQFCCFIPFRKRQGRTSSSDLPEQTHDFLVWYCKKQEALKYRQIWTDKEMDNLELFYNNSDGVAIALTKDEKAGKKPLPCPIEQVWTRIPLELQSPNPERMFNFEMDGKKHPHPPKGWSATEEQLKVAAEKKRLVLKGKYLLFKRYYIESRHSKLLSIWNDTAGEQHAIYVVQTSEKPIARCMLMTSDPGDLVMDITCGSGVTAYVAETYGRRWITCDTSRVAITLAKQRLMTASFDYWQLAHPNEGIKSGFEYNKTSHITIGSFTKGEAPKEYPLYDEPMLDSKKVRVTGPFTVEAVPCLRVKPFDGQEPKSELTGSELARSGETGRQTQWRDELKATGIRTLGGKTIMFSRVEPMVATRFLHAEAEIFGTDGSNKKAHISFGPDFGPLEQRQVEEALKEARALKEKPDFVIFAAFHFDPEAAKDIDQIEWKGVNILKTQMSVDLLTGDLRKKKSSNQSYWLIGQPDVDIKKPKTGSYQVKVNGFDYYDPINGEIVSKGTKHIAMWFLDTDYDERSLMPDQVFFPEGDSRRDWTKLSKALNGEVNEDALAKFSGVESLPFVAGDNKKIAVKIIDNRGIESFVIKNLG